MMVVAGVLVVGGLVGLAWGAMQRFKAARLASAPFAKTGDVASKGASVAGPKGEVSVEGTVRCAEPVVSPVTGTPCLYYEMKVVGYWKEGDQERSKPYADEKRAAAFEIDDGSGAVRVDASQGGDYEPFEKKFDETKREGMFADLKGALGKDMTIQFGKYSFQNFAGSVASKFVCTERVLGLQPRLYACGKLDGGRIGSPSWTSLILSSKSREELLGGTARRAKRFLVGGGATAGAGAVLALVAQIAGS